MTYRCIHNYKYRYKHTNMYMSIYLCTYLHICVGIHESMYIDICIHV